MTHAELVTRAERWLRKTAGCRVVLAECRSRHEPEVPDAIGWNCRGGQIRSVVVECKATRADFRADSQKVHRQLEGLGRWRWYMTPPGLVQADEVPAGWGLLEVRGNRVVKVKPTADRGRNPERTEREIRLMYSELTLVQGICLGYEPIPSRRVDWLIAGLDKSLATIKAAVDRQRRLSRDRKAAEKADKERFIKMLESQNNGGRE